MSIPSFLSSRYVEHPIDEALHKFWPVSTRTIFRLKGVSKPVAKALHMIFSPNGDDTGRKQKKMLDSQPNSLASDDSWEAAAIAPDLAKLRADQKQGAIDALVDTLLSEDASFVLADIVMDSMRDAGFPKNPSSQEKAAFLENVSGTIMAQMLAGVMKANRELFSPLEKRATEIWAALKNQVAVKKQTASNATTPKPSEEMQTTSTGTL